MTERSNPPAKDHRRTIVLVLAIVLLTTYVFSSWSNLGGASGEFTRAASGRIGLLLIALWLAWPSLRRPASWLPPGMAVAGVITLAVLAAQPKLIIAAVPAFLTLLTVAGFVRAFKQK